MTSAAIALDVLWCVAQSTGTATHTLQHTATHCNTPKHTATHTHPIADGP